MAKFRTNHAPKGSSGKDTIIKVGIFGAIISGLFYLFNFFAPNSNNESPGIDIQAEARPEVDDSEYFLPTSTTGQIIRHQFYTISYSEAHEQAEWVAYILRRDSLNKPWLERPKRFNEDPKVETRSSSHSDYSNSGYDRGHLVPAADMAYNQNAIEETFYMSNISPQSRNFNKGIWRELEELTRNWAKKFGQLYVITGPVLNQPIKGKIGDNKVSIPSAFFKVLLDYSEPEKKAIAFIIPNEISYEPLFKFAASVDEAETITGLDFFPDMLVDDLESTLNIDLWEFNKKKFEERIEKWNKE